MKLTLSFVPLLAALVLAGSADAATSTAARDWQFKDDSAGGLAIDNLVGDVNIERGTAAGFQVSVKVTAEAASAQEADRIARAVEFSMRDAGSSSSLQVLLPEAKFPTIYIAGVPVGWWVGDAKTEYLGEKRRVTGYQDKGVQVRVDIVVRAPEDARLVVRNLFGDAAAAGFSGELRLDGGRGRLSSRDGSGKIKLDSGSGPVEVSGHSGVVDADSGSGSVTISDCRCRINANTGSGSVTASILPMTERLVVDTGSGDVRVTGDLSGLKRLDVDTGSGGVQIEAAAWPAMEIAIDTGSGSVMVDVPAAEVTRHDGADRTVRIAGGGARGVIGTGSGSVRLRTTPAADRWRGRTLPTPIEPIGNADW